MLTYSFTDTEGLSLYEYIYKCIKEDIITGKLTANEKLPSKRVFAKNHGISTVTVENAYGQLMAEGYIYSEPKKGFFVSPIENYIEDTIIKEPYKPESSSNTQNSHGSQNIGRDLADSSSFYNYNSDDQHPVIDFISSKTPADNFPFATWSKIMRQTLGEQEEKLLSKPSAGGVWPLREAIARHLHDFRGISVHPEQIIVGAGTEYLYGLIVQLLGRDKTYGLENPCSNKIRNIYQSLDVKTMPIEMDDEGILPEQEGLKKSDVIQISPSHHFPTGVVTSISRRYAILGWANESGDRYIIEDDYDSEFRFTGKPILPLLCASKNENVIYINSFSKTLSPSFRISYMVLPKKLSEKFNSKFNFCSCTVNSFEQYALADFIKEEHYSKHIIRMKNYYRNLRNELIFKIENSELKNFVKIHEENSGLHFLISINSKFSGKTLEMRLKKNGIKISALKDFFYELEDFSIFSEYSKSFPIDKTFVINYSGIEKQKIPKTVELILKSIR